MTDKELKKLSKLELFELLLVESRENERLREELEQMKQENSIKKSVQQLNKTAENLAEISEKLGATLQQLPLIANSLNNMNESDVENKTDSFSNES